MIKMATLHVMQTLHPYLHAMHFALRRLDLNLLLVFDALHRWRSVTAAAEELALSTSAFSHALSRLRTALHDELFLRVGGSMQPTPRAQELADGISQALQLLADRIGDAHEFDPATSEHTFVFAATDFTTYALLPSVVTAVERETPGVRMRVIPSQSRDVLADLVQGAHFVLGFSDEVSPVPTDIERLEAPSDDYVVVARRGHPRLGKRLTLKRYLAEHHVVVRPWRNEASVIDTALAAQGHKRIVAIELPSVMAAPFIVTGTDHLITLPRQAARQLAASAQVVVHEAPFPTPHYIPTVYYQRRHMHLAWHRWMRNRLLSAIAPTIKSA